MRIVSSYLIVSTLTCCVLACSTLKVIEQETLIPIGNYQYAGYDKQGGKVVEGRLSITSVETRRIRSEESILIKGNWQLNKVGNQERIGPQVGSGDLVGGIVEGEIQLDLNPNVDDSSVIVRGKIKGRRFQGTWSFNGYAGAISKGTFEATRK